MKLTKVFFEIAFVLLPLLDAFLGAPYFLNPRYSLFGGQTPYTKVIPCIDLGYGKYELTVTTSTGMGNCPTNLFSLSAALLDYTVADECPKGYVRHYNLFSETTKPCVAGRASVPNFVMFDPTFDTGNSTSYMGPRARSTVVQTHHLNIPTHDTGSKSNRPELHLNLYMYDNLHSDCQTTEECIPWLNRMKRDYVRDGDMSLINDSLACLPAEICHRKGLMFDDMNMCGCLVGVQTANKQDCMPPASGISKYFSDLFHMDEIGTGDCAFTIDFEILGGIPSFLAPIWSFGPIVFMSLFVINVLVKLMKGRAMHQNYVAFYYFRKQPFHLERGMNYKLKLYVTGQQYTVAKGLCKLFSGHTPIYVMPLRVSFGEEDVEGTGIHTALIEGWFAADKSHRNVEFSINWDDQFHLAGSAVVRSVQMVLRRRIPTLVKNQVQVLWMPITYVMHVVLNAWGQRSELLHMKDLTFLVFYLLIVQLGWIQVMLVLFLVYPHSTLVSDWFWSSQPLRRPLAPLINYWTFVACLFLPNLLKLLPYCRPYDKNEVPVDLPDSMQGSGPRMTAEEQRQKHRNAMQLSITTSSGIAKEYGAAETMNNDFVEMRDTPPQELENLRRMPVSTYSVDDRGDSSDAESRAKKAGSGDGFRGIVRRVISRRRLLNGRGAPLNEKSPLLPKASKSPSPKPPPRRVRFSDLSPDLLTDEDRQETSLSLNR